MQRTIKIADKEVTLKATAYTLVVYQAEFDEDMFIAQDKVLKAINGDEVVISKIDTLYTLKILWALIKTADESLPSFNDWIKDLPEVPMVELYSDYISLLTANMITHSDIAGSVTPKNAEGTVTGKEE